MRDLPDTADLLVLARRLLRDELAPLLPAERERDAHLIATALSIAARELAAADRWRGEIERLVAEFYSPHPRESGGPGMPGSGGGSPSLPAVAGMTEEAGAPRLARLAADLRNGAFETSPSQEAAVRAILWRMIGAKLRETNPQFLAANGFA